MPNQQQRPGTTEWPGDWVFYSSWAYHNGLTSDSRGSDAIDHWAQDKSQEDIDAMLKRAESLGFLTGFFGTLPLWSRFWSWLLGNK